MSKEDINSLFNKKRQALQDSIDKNLSLIGTDPPKGFFPLAMAMIIKNIQDLYGVTQAAINIMIDYRQELDGFKNISSKTDFKVGFGSLENKLKRINEKDEEETRKGNNPFYG